MATLKYRSIGNKTEISCVKALRAGVCAAIGGAGVIAFHDLVVGIPDGCNKGDVNLTIAKQPLMLPIYRFLPRSFSVNVRGINVLKIQTFL
jgi:hypothetical protein